MRPSVCEILRGEGGAVDVSAPVCKCSNVAVTTKVGGSAMAVRLAGDLAWAGIGS